MHGKQDRVQIQVEEACPRSARPAPDMDSGTDTRADLEGILGADFGGVGENPLAVWDPACSTW